LAARRRASLDDILTRAGGQTEWTSVEVEEELNNNAQSILGYVVALDRCRRGLFEGADYYKSALMEDRATLRISSQHVANCCATDLFARTGDDRPAAHGEVVDEQNSGDPAYEAMSRILRQCRIPGGMRPRIQGA